MPPPVQSAPRVLCLTLRSGSVGHAVLDGFGVAEGSFFTSRLDHLPPQARFRALLRLLTASCRRFQPSRVVLGLPGKKCSDRVALAERLRQHLDHLGIASSMKRLRDAAVLLVTRVRFTMADEIVQQLATHFVPEVTPMVSREHPRAWYWRPAWYAVAVALAVLVEHHPLVAAALARPGAFRIPAFHAAILAAERGFAPHLV